MNYYHKEFIYTEVAAIQIKEDNYDEIIDFINKFIDLSDIEIVTLKDDIPEENMPSTLDNKINIIYSTGKTKLIIFYINHIKNKIINVTIIDKSIFLGFRYVQENVFHLEDYIIITKNNIISGKNQIKFENYYTKEKDLVTISSNIDDESPKSISINEFKKYINDNL